MLKRKRRKGASRRSSVRRRRSSNPVTMVRRGINTLLPRGFKL